MIEEIHCLEEIQFVSCASLDYISNVQFLMHEKMFVEFKLHFFICSLLREGGSKCDNLRAKKGNSLRCNKYHIENPLQPRVNVNDGSFTFTSTSPSSCVVLHI